MCLPCQTRVWGRTALRGIVLSRSFRSDTDVKQRIPVIPVLVQDVPMSDQESLPENIRPLARRNGIALSATRWRTDVERLIKELDRVMKA